MEKVNDELNVINSIHIPAEKLSSCITYDYDTLVGYVGNGSFTHNPEDIDLIEWGYELIFNTYCSKYPDKEALYRTMLRINNSDYRLTVIQIETSD